MSHKESFLQYLQIEKRYSLHTVRSYLNDLDQFYHFLLSLGLPEDPVAVTSHDIRAWIVSMLDNNYSTVSVHRKISCLRVFYRYLRKEGIIKNDPLEKVVLPKRKKTLPVFIEEEAINNLLDDPLCGINVPRPQWPKEYIKMYKINCLYKYKLPNGWRLIYTVRGNEIEIVAVILEWMTHKEYDRRFKY